MMTAYKNPAADIINAREVSAYFTAPMLSYNLTAVWER